MVVLPGGVAIAFSHLVSATIIVCAKGWSSVNYQIVRLDAGLTFVGVPIGTARDITLRALDVLASAEVLAAEDTRSLRKLMDIHGIPLERRTLIALHDHSNTSTIQRLVDAVSEGKSVAYASEAGMPMIADPGFELANAMVKAGHSVTCAPGPSALPTALVLAGLPTDAFFFAGFLPNTSNARKTALEALKEIQATLVLYESPKRLGAMLQDASAVLGRDRKVAVCRELTKKFEEVRRGTLQELVPEYQEKSPKGEIAVLIDRARSPSVNPETINNVLQDALRDMSVRDAVDMVSQAYDLPRRKVYQAALAIEKEDK